MRHLTNVVGFDDAPFPHHHRGDVLLVGAVCARTRLDGVISGRVRRDGSNAARTMAAIVRASQFARHVRAVILQGIAVAGFNVVDVHTLARDLGPVLVVMRRPPKLAAMRAAIERVPAAARKWALVEAAGPIEPLGDVWVQRVGLSRDEAAELLAATTLHGNLPEPLRLAHLIAGGVTTGKSRGRA